jgi:MarR family transcriptional regulator, organic hydroperoxide resistance regulator
MSQQPKPSLPPSAAALHLNQQLCFPLYAASNLMTRLYRPLLQQLGLTYPQYLVMLVLWESAPCNVSELGERLMLDSGTLTPLLKRLEAAGLVQRSRDTADERRVQVSLSPAGLALRGPASEVPSALACRVLGDTSADPQDLAELRTRLQTLVHTLSQALDTPTPDASGTFPQP